MPGHTAKDIAIAVLQKNAKKVLHAGQGHFRYMWVTDFGKCLPGAYLALSNEYIEHLIEEMIECSAKMGYVPTCFVWRGNLRGFDMPYARADNLPWLMHAIRVHCERTGSRELVAKYGKALRQLISKWEAEHLQDGLVARSIKGDWMDTVLRPSSTYNNLCALYMFQTAGLLGIPCQTDPKAFEARILKDRWRGDHFIDFADTDRPSVDAAVLTLYLELFNAKVRHAAADWLEQSGLTKSLPIHAAADPYPQKMLSLVARVSPQYHSSVWLHLGAMYINGLHKLGRKEATGYRRAFEDLIVRHGNVLETLNPVGRHYKTTLHATEYGLSMAAGQYLECCLQAK